MLRKRNSQAPKVPKQICPEKQRFDGLSVQWFQLLNDENEIIVQSRERKCSEYDVLLSQTLFVVENHTTFDSEESWKLGWLNKKVNIDFSFLKKWV